MREYKELGSLELLIQEAQKALDRDCLFATLALLLAIPDICGCLMYPELGKGKTRSRYIKWFDEYIGNYELSPSDKEAGRPMPHLTGELVYEFRCAFLHAGNTGDVEGGYTKWSKADPDNNTDHPVEARMESGSFNLDNFVIAIQAKNEFDMYSDMAGIEASEGKTYSEYVINIRRLGVTILNSARATLNDLNKQGAKFEFVKVCYLD